jgi:hypothetical protein
LTNTFAAKTVLQIDTSRAKSVSAAQNPIHPLFSNEPDIANGIQWQ